MNYQKLSDTLINTVGDKRGLNFFRQLPSELSEGSIWNKRLECEQNKYFLLYTGPIIEFIVSTKDNLIIKQEPYWSSLLSSHLILSFYLRIMDDVVDEDIHGLELKKAIRQSENLLAEAIRRINNCGLDWNFSSQFLCDKWILYEETVLEGRRLIFDDLWERASTLLVVPQIYGGIPEEDLQMFRNYLSLLMLIHDVQDVFDDIREGRRTIPIEILKSFHNDIFFSPETIKMVFDTLNPLINHQFKQLEKYAQSRGFLYWPILLNNIHNDLLTVY